MRYCLTCYLAWALTALFRPELSELGGEWFYLFLHLATFVVFLASMWRFFATPFALGPSHPDLPRPTNDPLLTLRGVAACCVLFGHGIAIAFPPAELPKLLANGNPIWLLLPSPWSGVGLFFVLSGYLMGKGFFVGRYSLSRAGIKSFYLSRAFRITPLYVLAVLLVSIFKTPEIFSPTNIWQLLSILLFDYPGTFANNPIGALWSVSTEVQFYVGVPILFTAVALATKRANPEKILSRLLLGGLMYRLSVLWIFGHSAWYDRTYVPLIGNLDLFLAGIVTSWLVSRASSSGARLFRLDRLSTGLLVLGLTYLVAAVAFSAVLASHSARWVLDIVWGVMPTGVAIATVYAIFLFETAARNREEASGISLRIVARTQWVGILTYAMYVWHEPIYLGLAARLPPSTSAGFSVAYLIGALGVVFAASYVANVFVERPFARLKFELAAR